MVAIIDEKLAAIEQLCRAHHVQRLEVFGSAARGSFDLADSDLDFAVEFLPLSPAQRSTAYFGLLAAFQDLFLRDIDLVEMEAISNPYFLKAFNSCHQLVYAA